MHIVYLWPVSGWMHGRKAEAALGAGDSSPVEASPDIEDRKSCASESHDADQQQERGAARTQEQAIGFGGRSRRVVRGAK